MLSSTNSLREASMLNGKARTATVGVAAVDDELDAAAVANGKTVTSAAAAADGDAIESSEQTVKSLMQRYWPIMTITWILHFGLGLSISITGPTLPYLALNTDQSLGSAGLIYTARSIIVCITSIVTGIVIARLQSSRSKLLLLLAGSVTSMMSSMLTPYMLSPVLLIAAQCLFGIGAGMVDTTNNMLVIFLFGPIKSRSFSHSLHLCVGLGGFVAPLLARPFLELMGDVGSDGSICGPTAPAAAVANGNGSVIDLQALKWPFLIIGSFHAVWICGYAVLLIMNFQLERFAQSSKVIDAAAEADSPKPTVPAAAPTAGMSLKRKSFVIILFIIFYILHVGQENTFWSHLFSFGVCSKLNMSPGQASLLSTVFFIGFLTSRAAGIVIAKLMSPAKILMIQLTGCMLATAVLAVWGESSDVVAFIAAGVYGFCIAMVFPTGITWLASKLDVTGALSSSWFIGAYIGNSVYPLAAGELIQSVAGAISMMYLAVATSVAYLIVVVVMFIVAK